MQPSELDKIKIELEAAKRDLAMAQGYFDDAPKDEVEEASLLVRAYELRVNRLYKEIKGRFQDEEVV